MHPNTSQYIPIYVLGCIGIWDLGYNLTQVRFLEYIQLQKQLMKLNNELKLDKIYLFV
jgi:hypothetical protein